MDRRTKRKGHHKMKASEMINEQPIPPTLSKRQVGDDGDPPTSTSCYQFPKTIVCMDKGPVPSNSNLKARTGDSAPGITNEENPPRDLTEEESRLSEMQRFVEISNYFTEPHRRSASYITEFPLVSFPRSYKITFSPGGLTTHYVQFSNLTLEPVYIKLYKVIPDLEQLKIINFGFARTKRIPPGLSFRLGFVYDNLNEKYPSNTKMIFVASRKTTTPCYQICEIDVQIESPKRK